MTNQNYPPGWDEQRVSDLLAHYENQTPEEAVAEDEAAYDIPEGSKKLAPG